MKTVQKLTEKVVDGRENVLFVAILSLLVGAVAGLVGAAFRFTLNWADKLRDALIAWAHGEGIAGFLIVIATFGAACAIAAWLVRRFSPHASGSGIPHVEAVLDKRLPPAPLTLIPVKFVGGILAIGSGLALGREGPSVQMAASVAYFFGTAFRRSWSDCRVLLAAGAGAGLATAFNAPIAGAVFVLEELVRRFETRITVAALGASATAIAVARLLLGNSPEFRVEPMREIGWDGTVLCFVLGGVTGLVAVAYNRTLLGAIAAAARLARISVEVRAALIGAAVGILAWFAPEWVGGGDSLTQRALTGGMTVSVISLAFLLRFALGAVSYAAQTPGGLFAPMLALGALVGLFFGMLCRYLHPGLETPPELFAVVGMAAFFTGVVRAPATGIVLIIEMTSDLTVLQPMLGACFTAMLVPTLLGNPPIYDSLREPAAERSR
jgi:CIC family chloride channel protein